jgi:hypothetical protein
MPELIEFPKSNLLAHIILAYTNYEQCFDMEFDLVCSKIPAWGKEQMWDEFYLPFADEQKEAWDAEMMEYLQALR